MLFTRLIAFALPAVSFALVGASPAPVTAVAKRQLNELAPLAIFTTLQTTMNPILSQISTFKFQLPILMLMIGVSCSPAHH
jgi:hypothetical protein